MPSRAPDLPSSPRLVRLTDPRLGSLDGIYVELPQGQAVGEGSEASEVLSDMANFVVSLLRSRKIALPGQPSLGATHEVTRDAEGHLRLNRKRFAAR